MERLVSRRRIDLVGPGVDYGFRYVTGLSEFLCAGLDQSHPPLGEHIGLTPRQYQSGEVDRSGRISRCGDTLART
jgi:Transposase IS116/IS110/IS902 family